MTLEGEYYTRSTTKCSCPSLVAILMTLEGEYYCNLYNPPLTRQIVAILMTLEGEYYCPFSSVLKRFVECRNPHDIGRRILRRVWAGISPQSQVAILMTLEGEYYEEAIFNPRHSRIVAILMTLEGEYYIISLLVAT